MISLLSQQPGIEKQAAGGKVIGQAIGALLRGAWNHNWAGGLGRGIKSVAKRLPGDLKAGRKMVPGSTTKWQWDPSNATFGDGLYALGDLKFDRTTMLINELDRGGKHGYATFLRALHDGPSALRSGLFYSSIPLYAGGQTYDLLRAKQTGNFDQQSLATRIGDKLMQAGMWMVPLRSPVTNMLAQWKDAPSYVMAQRLAPYTPNVVRNMASDAKDLALSPVGYVWNNAVAAYLQPQLEEAQRSMLNQVYNNRDALAAGLAFAPSDTMNALRAESGRKIAEGFERLLIPYGDDYKQYREWFKQTYGYYPGEQPQ